MYEVRGRPVLQLPPGRQGWRRAHGVHCHALTLIAALALQPACRIGFDARATGDAREADAIDGTVFTGTPMSLVLPEGGQFRDLAVSPVDGTWYALSFHGGAFRSTDAGASWQRCGTAAITSLEVASDGAVFASGTNVWRSTDGCVTWSSTAAPVATLAIGNAGTTTYALGDSAMYRYTGSAWVQVPTPADGELYISFAGTAPTLVAGTYGNGLVVSTDGTNWTRKTAGLTTQIVADVGASATTMYALTAADNTGDGGVSCSDETGATWSECLTDGGLALALDPLDPQHVVVAVYDDLGETTDGFTSFDRGLRQQSGLSDAIVHDLHYTASGELLMATERGVFVSPGRPLAFEPKLAGLSAWTINAILRDGDDVFVTTEAGTLRSLGGAPFDLSTTGMDWNVTTARPAIAPDGTLIVPGRSIWGSTDRGATWIDLEDLDGTDGFRATAVAFDGARAFVGTKDRVHVADPPYTTWTQHLIGGGTEEVFDIAVAGDRLYLATASGLFDSGDSAVSSELVAPVPAPANGLAVLGDGGVAVATGNGVWISDTTRTTWTGTVAGTKLTDIVLAGDRIVAVGPGGAFVSADRGQTWTPIPSPAGVLLVTAIHDPADDSLVLGTYGHGLVRVPLP